LSTIPVINPDNTSALHSLTAVILAGGLGTRLRDVVNDVPKPMAEVAGRPFLAYLLDQLAEAGVRRVVLCTGHLAERVVAGLGEQYAGISLIHSREDQPLGTAGALRQAQSHIDSETAIVLNGDSYCQADLSGFYAQHVARNAAGSLLLVRQTNTQSFGRVELDSEGKIERFLEKGTSAEPGWINAGVYLLSRSLIAEIAPGRAVSLERETFPAWIGRGLYGDPRGAAFLDIGTPESYRRAEQFFSALANASAQGGHP
jgi:NDP-sugar pyrophosphorylase family protein